MAPKKKGAASSSGSSALVAAPSGTQVGGPCRCCPAIRRAQRRPAAHPAPSTPQSRKDTVPEDIKAAYLRFAKLEPKKAGAADGKKAGAADGKKRDKKDKGEAMCDEGALAELQRLVKERPSGPALLALAKAQFLRAMAAALVKTRSAASEAAREQAVMEALLAAGAVATEGAMQHKSAMCLVRAPRRPAALAPPPRAPPQLTPPAARPRPRPLPRSFSPTKRSTSQTAPSWAAPSACA